MSSPVRFVSLAHARRATVVLGALALIAGCSSVENFMSGDKVDYRTQGTTRTTGLEVPPDLTQLAKDSRYQVPGGTVSASSFQSAASAPAAAPAASSVAPQAVGDIKIERLGNDRWISTPQPPEEVYPKLRAFWRDSGFTLVEDRPEAGVMETDWAENRAKLPNDLIRGTIGKVFDGAWSTGELDKFRTRVEHNASGGSDIYITHRGMVELYVGQAKEETRWQPRPADPQLEGEFLSRVMVKLGTREEVAKAAVAPAPSGTARARVVDGQPAATLQVDDGFDRAWRRVGLALDRSGFTVEDRDRTQGVYFVRYVDPKLAGREQPGFLSRVFSFGKKPADAALERYRVTVKGEGEKTLVSVLDGKGAPENGDAGKHIVTLLVDDLK